MNEFGRFHPTVNFIYFFAVIGFSMFFMHPICLGISLVCGLSYSVLLGGKGALKFNLIYILPLMLVSAILNPAFNHEGATVLCYLPSGNPLTKESILNGAAVACMLGAVIFHFSCFNKIMTSDKLIYLFGRIIPALSLILSMVLRFVPKFSAKLKEVRSARHFLNADEKPSLLGKLKSGIKILSAMITWSLESSVETADSMKSRGYGLPNRTAFSNYKFTKRDGMTLLLILCLSVYILIGSISGGVKFSYFPILAGAEMSVYTISIFTAYLMLCISPIIIEVWEDRRWKKLKSIG